MSRPGWFDELPESMSEAEYRELPEDIARTIEVVYGHVIKCESPVPRHNRIARRLWEIREFHLDAATSAFRLYAVHRSVLDLEQPVRLLLPISDLVAP